MPLLDLRSLEESAYLAPASAQLTLSLFSPVVQTPVIVAPGVGALTLSTFAPSAVTPRTVVPGLRTLTLTTFAPDVQISSPSVMVTPPSAALSLITYAPRVQGDPVLSTDASGGGTILKILRETEIVTLPLPFKVPHHDLPVAPEPLKAQIVELPKHNDADAYIALFAAGELNEDEFVALLAA